MEGGREEREAFVGDVLLNHGIVMELFQVHWNALKLWRLVYLWGLLARGWGCTCSMTVSIGAWISMARVYQASSWLRENLSLTGNSGRAETARLSAVVDLTASW